MLVLGYGPSKPPPWDYTTQPPYDCYILDAPSGRIVSRLTHGHYGDEGAPPYYMHGPVFTRSPDGRKLASRILGGIGVVDIASQQWTHLTTDSSDALPRWGPDSRTVFFLRKSYLTSPRGFIKSYYLYRASLDSVGIARKVFDYAIVFPNYDIKFDQ